MKTFIATGPKQYTNCQIDSDTQPTGAMTQRITVAEGTAALLATICDPDTGLCPAASSVTLTITGPDGTLYNLPANQSGLFVNAASGSIYVFGLLAPAAGLWTISVRCTIAVTYRANLFTVPATAAFDSALFTLQQYFPDGAAYRGAELNYHYFHWIFWPVSVLVRAGLATPALALNLAQLLMQVYGISATTAQQLLASVTGQSVEAVTVTTAQLTGQVTEAVAENELVNGDAAQGLSGWTILANGGSGWSVQAGYASRIQFGANFAVSNGWCKKAQTIDLVAAGLPPQFLDQGPTLVVRDWLTANYPAGVTAQSQYYLTVQLRDASQNVIKQFQTGVVAVPAAPGQTAPRLSWLRFESTFSGYGAGVRYVYFEHGGLDPQVFTADYGLKLTGAAAVMALAMPARPSVEVLQNGSAQNGMAGWTVLGSTPWTVETGPGIDCPLSVGTNDFAVTTGSAGKYQLIDLIAAGYAADFLDQSPVIQFADWMCAQPNCSCSYYWKIQLRDANQNVLLDYSPGTIQVPPSPGAFTPFFKFAQDFSEYGTGLRYLYFEHGATAGSPTMSAKLTGASVLLPAPPPVLTAKRALLTAPTPIQNTTVVPYRWVCQIIMTFPGQKYSSCTAWLVPSPRANAFQVITAGHCIKSGTGGWPTNIAITPAQGNSGGSPYQTVNIPRGRMQVAINWLLKNQTEVRVYGDLFDYAALYVNQATNWDPSGFVLTVEDDNTLYNQAGTITGFPADAPYGGDKMYTQDINLYAWNKTQVSASTDFTPGSSGGPIYVRNTANAVSLMSYGDKLGWLNQGTTRITNAVKSDLNLWATPLQATDRITKLQMVIRTGEDLGAGTDDDLLCVIDGQTYNLEDLWFDGAAGLLRSRNERGDYDGYDLTSRLNAVYPQGITIQYLLGKNYSIQRDPSFWAYHAWANGDWQVESVAIFVNGQMLCAKNFNKWVQAYGGQAADRAASAPFTLG